MCGGRTGPGGASRLWSCQACGGNLGFPCAGASSLPPSQRFARLLASPPDPHLALSRYDQVSCSIADAGGVVGILGPGPFKVRGARFQPGPSRSRSVPGQGPRHSPAWRGHHQPQSRIGDKERFLCQWRLGLIQKRQRRQRLGYWPGHLPFSLQALSAHRSCLGRFSSFFLSFPPFFPVFSPPFFFSLLLHSFPPSLYFCFVLSLSVPSFLSLPPFLPNSSFWGTQG